MIIGFTGTRRGMTLAQKHGVERLLLLMDVARSSEKRVCGPVTEVHHGDCLGADEEFHNLVLRILPGAKIVVHPPIEIKHRAFCLGDVVEDEKPYIERNHDVVNASDVVIGAPAQAQEQRRSGTWATIRYARLNSKLIQEVPPQGRQFQAGESLT